MAKDKDKSKSSKTEMQKRDNSSTLEDRKRAIDEAIVGIDKEFGKGTIMRLGDAPLVKIESIPTGCLSLDVALGIFGVPKGRIVEVYGPESSGKTTLCLHIIAEAQKRGGLAAFIDVEHALDTDYAAKLGVDVPNLMVSQPDYGEQALEVAERLVRSSGFDVIIIDSVAALVPRSEIEGEMGDASMAVQARLMSQALRKLTAVVSNSGTCLLFTNQLRQKIGVMFGNPETTTGGNALKFYASVRMDIRRIAAIKKNEVVIGNRTRVKIVKSKVAPPFREVEFDIIYAEGISKVGDLLDLSVSCGVVKKSGAWLTYKEDRFQGRETAMEALKEDPILFDTLKQEVLEELANQGRIK